jgi:hypothetical protein
MFYQDKNDQILSHTFKKGFPVELKDANRVPADATQHVQLLNTEEGLVYDFAVPVTISNERLGTVHVGVSQVKAQAAVRRLLFIIFCISAGSGLMAVVLGTLFAGTVTRRLNVLRQSAEDIVRGNLDLQTGPQLKRNCWDIKDCQQPQCPAYNDTRRCWYLVGTMCPEAAGGSNKIRSLPGVPGLPGNQGR